MSGKALKDYDFLFSTMGGIFQQKGGEINLVYNRPSEETVDCFPITWDAQHYYFGENRHFSQETYIHVATKEGFHKEGEILIDGLFDVHQMVHHQGKLYICNTGQNSLVVYDLKDKKVSHEILRGSERKDLHHINGVWINKGKIYTTYLKQAQDYKSDIIVHDLVTYEQLDVMEVGQGIHNVFIQGNKLYTCSSHSRQLLCVDLESHANVYWQFSEWKDYFWLRGMASDGEVLIVGGSQVKPRDYRHNINKNMIYLFDMELNLLEEFEFNQTKCGPIYDIRLLEGDKAHL